MADNQFIVRNGLSVNGSFIANSTTISIPNTATLIANGSPGSAGYQLTSNGAGIYWNAPATLSVNVASQYAWTNTQSFSNTITFSGSILGNTVNAVSFTVGSSFVANSTGGYDTIGNLRSVPINNKSSVYQLASTDNGQTISITTGGVTVNGAVLSIGQCFSIFNNSGSNQNITSGTGVTMYLGGTATTGTRTLAQYGIATSLMVASNTFVISGAGVT